jgi:hypothetical protein
MWRSPVWGRPSPLVAMRAVTTATPRCRRDDLRGCRLRFIRSADDRAHQVRRRVRRGPGPARLLAVDLRGPRPRPPRAMPGGGVVGRVRDPVRRVTTGVVVRRAPRGRPGLGAPARRAGAVVPRSGGPIGWGGRRAPRAVRSIRPSCPGRAPARCSLLGRGPAMREADDRDAAATEPDPRRAGCRWPELVGQWVHLPVRADLLQPGPGDPARHGWGDRRVPERIQLDRESVDGRARGPDREPARAAGLLHGEHAWGGHPERGAKRLAGLPGGPRRRKRLGGVVSAQRLPGDDHAGGPASPRLLYQRSLVERRYRCRRAARGGHRPRGRSVLFPGPLLDRRGDVCVGRGDPSPRHGPSQSGPAAGVRPTCAGRLEGCPRRPGATPARGRVRARRLRRLRPAQRRAAGVRDRIGAPVRLRCGCGLRCQHARRCRCPVVHHASGQGSSPDARHRPRSAW